MPEKVIKILIESSSGINTTNIRIKVKYSTCPNKGNSIRVHKKNQHFRRLWYDRSESTINTRGHFRDLAIFDLELDGI